MSFKDARICSFSDHDGSMTVPTGTVFAYTPDGKTITAFIWWYLGDSLHSITYALASEGIPEDLPNPDDSNIAERIETLINQGSLIPFGEELASLGNLFLIEDLRPETDHTFVVWCHTGKPKSRPSLLPGKVYGCYVDGCVGRDHEPNFPESMDLEALGTLLADESAAVVACPSDAPERHGVTLCDMGSLYSQLASA